MSPDDAIWRDATNVLGHVPKIKADENEFL